MLKYAKICFIKVLKEAACLQLAERLFHSFALLSEKYLLLLGNLRSDDALDSLYEVLCEFLLKELLRYGAVSSIGLLVIIFLDSMSISMLIVFHPSCWICRKLLFVTMLAALFYSFCKRLISVVPA